jgi:hypothetical protein
MHQGVNLGLVSERSGGKVVARIKGLCELLTPMQWSHARAHSPLMESAPYCAVRRGLGVLERVLFYLGWPSLKPRHKRGPLIRRGVCRQSISDSWLGNLRECLAHLV